MDLVSLILKLIKLIVVNKVILFFNNIASPEIDTSATNCTVYRRIDEKVANNSSRDS